MAGQAFLENLFAGDGILRVGGLAQCGRRQQNGHRQSRFHGLGPFLEPFVAARCIGPGFASPMCQPSNG
jgi:hypothetical protein